MTDPDPDQDLDLLDSVDSCLDPLVPHVPVPTDLALRGRRARRRRTTLRAAVTGAAAAVVAGVIGFTVLPGDDAAEPVPFAPAPPTTSAVPAEVRTHLVGYDGLAVILPNTWSAQSEHCRGSALPEVAEVYFADASQKRPCAQRTALSVSRVGDDQTAQLLAAGAVEVTVRGMTALRRDTCTPDVACTGSRLVSLYLPALGLEVFAVGSDVKLVGQIAASVRPIPDGLIAVPLIECCPSDTEAIQILEDAGLTARSPAADFPHYTTATVPPAGTLVRPGTEIELVPGDG